MESGERQSADARARGHEQGSGDRRRPPAACARRPTSRIRLVGHQWVHCRRVHQGLGCRCRRPRRPAPRQTQAKSCVAVPARRSRAVALAKVARASLEQRIATAPGSMPPRAHRPSPAAKARRRRFQLERKPSDAVLLSRPGPTMDLVPTREPSPIFALCQPKCFLLDLHSTPRSSGLPCAREPHSQEQCWLPHHHPCSTRRLILAEGRRCGRLSGDGAAPSGGDRREPQLVDDIFDLHGIAVGSTGPYGGPRAHHRDGTRP